MTVDPARSNRHAAGVVLHRAADRRTPIRSVDGIHVTCVERALVDAWGRPGGLTLPAVRAAVITAVRRRMCRPRDLAAELDRRPQLRARASLVELVRLLAEGCQSELEIWGCLNVLRAPGMPRFTLQHRVTVAGRTIFLDAACEEAQLAVEMDGAAWHGSREQRERDVRRDALLAASAADVPRSASRELTGPPGSPDDIRAVNARTAPSAAVSPEDAVRLRPRSDAGKGADVRFTPRRRRLRGDAGLLLPVGRVPRTPPGHDDQAGDEDADADHQRRTDAEPGRLGVAVRGVGEVADREPEQPDQQQRPDDRAHADEQERLTLRVSCRR